MLPTAVALGISVGAWAWIVRANRRSVQILMGAFDHSIRPRGKNLLTPIAADASISVTDILVRDSNQQKPNEPLTPAVFHILLALSDGERHGYAIMQTVAEETGGTFTMGPGTLYGSIKRMIDAGLIAEAGERQDPAMNDERRRYYRITASGTKAATAEAKRLEMLVHMARGKALLGRAKEA